MHDILTVKFHLRYPKDKLRSYPRIKEWHESEKEIWCIMKLSIVQEIKRKKTTGKLLTSEINVDTNAYRKYQLKKSDSVTPFG